MCAISSITDHNRIQFFLHVQDKKDDVLVGIKSTALKFGENTKLWLSCFSTAMITGLTVSGFVCDQTWPYYGTVGLVAAHLAQQIWSLNIDNPKDCAQKFISNHQVGLLIFVGIVLGTLLKVATNDKSTSKTKSTPVILPQLSREKLVQR